MISDPKEQLVISPDSQYWMSPSAKSYMTPSMSGITSPTQTTVIKKVTEEIRMSEFPQQKRVKIITKTITKRSSSCASNALLGSD